MTDHSFEILGRPIGSGHPAYIVAEVGINHGGDVELAKRQISAAAEAGADAVKLQTFRPELFISRSSPYYSIFEDTALSERDISTLHRYADKHKIVLFSAVFDAPSAALWHSLAAPAYKIASGDLTHLPLIRVVAGFGKPMLVSTGCGDIDEIARAIEAIRETNPLTPIALFHCVSKYPTEPKETNLAVMSMLREQFHVPTGFSDHTEGFTVPVAAVSLGAELIEKHFTHDRQASGPDHALSLDPEGFASMVDMVREAEAAIGSPTKTLVEGSVMRSAIRRSVTAFVDIPAGSLIEPGMLAVKRPGTGISPDGIDRIIGRRATRDLATDETIVWDDIAE